MKNLQCENPRLDNYGALRGCCDSAAGRQAQDKVDEGTEVFRNQGFVPCNRVCYCYVSAPDRQTDRQAGVCWLSV